MYKGTCPGIKGCFSDLSWIIGRCSDSIVVKPLPKGRKLGNRSNSFWSERDKKLSRVSKNSRVHGLLGSVIVHCTERFQCTPGTGFGVFSSRACASWDKGSQHSSSKMSSESTLEALKKYQVWEAGWDDLGWCYNRCDAAWDGDDDQLRKTWMPNGGFPGSMLCCDGPLWWRRYRVRILRCALFRSL